jgi:lysophospholipid acyltransferase (LPLAT)-like uncharacterized protein
LQSRKRDSEGFTFSQRIARVVVPPLTALVLAAIGVTLRFRVIAEEGAEPPRPYAHGIYCYWHRCTLAAAWYFRKYGCTILISRSFDGELITRASALLGYRSVRGSSTRGGAAGLLAFQDVVRRGTPAVFTADGPRGPIYQAKIGSVKLAQITGAPMGSFYMLPERAWVLKSWDRLLVPKPFSRVVISWSRMIAAPPKDADEAALEAVRLELNDSLERARARAEAHFEELQENH